jgi:hypothetical protein
MQIPSNGAVRNKEFLKQALSYKVESSVSETLKTLTSDEEMQGESQRDKR